MASPPLRFAIWSRYARYYNFLLKYKPVVRLKIRRRSPAPCASRPCGAPDASPARASFRLAPWKPWPPTPRTARSVCTPTTPTAPAPRLSRAPCLRL
eukprot:7879561-Pyramimonas_sp.AAC.1